MRRGPESQVSIVDATRTVAPIWSGMRPTVTAAGLPQYPHDSFLLSTDQVGDTCMMRSDERLVAMEPSATEELNGRQTCRGKRVCSGQGQERPAMEETGAIDPWRSG
jgi:hypothetical protein